MIWVVCAGRNCGRLIPSGSGGRCPNCVRVAGTGTARWRAVRLAAYVRDGFRCVDCGTAEDLTGHLDPSLEGNHELATVDDVTTLCRSCHGSRDASRVRSG